MALQVTSLPRKFKFNDLMLDDPDPKMSPQNVLGYYANLYPELTSGLVEGPTMKNDHALYEFSGKPGLKG